MLQFDVCCKGIDQNFDRGCDRYAILHLDSLPEVQIGCVGITIIGVGTGGWGGGGGGGGVAGGPTFYRRKWIGPHYHPV